MTSSSWVKLSTSILTDPDIGGLTDAAFRAYIRGLAYCGQHLTDGDITDKALRMLGVPSDAVTELATEGLWITTDDGYTVRNYLSHQQSREQVEHARANDRQRKAEQRKKRAGSRVREESTPDTPQVPAGLTAGVHPVEKKRREEKRNPPTTSRVGVKALPVDNLPDWYDQEAG